MQNYFRGEGEEEEEEEEGDEVVRGSSRETTEVIGILYS